MSNNAKTALALVSIALTMFVGIILKYWILHG
jgi:hypothetical protein